MSIEHPCIKITPLEDNGDERGSFLRIPRHQEHILPGIADMHIVTIRPGHVRGNHYHTQCRETAIVLYEDDWSLYWYTGSGTEQQSKYFKGRGALLIEIEPRVSHAFKNNGNSDLYIIAMTDKKYNAANPDVFKSVLTD